MTIVQGGFARHGAGCSGADRQRCSRTPIPARSNWTWWIRVPGWRRGYEGMELGLPVVWQFARVSGGDVALLAVPEVAQAGLRRSRGHGCGFALLAVCLLVQSMWTPATAFRLHHSSSGIGWTAVMFVLAADKARPPDHFSGRPLVSRPGRPVRAGPLRAVRSQGDLFRRALTPGATLLDAENANLRSALEGAVGGQRRRVRSASGERHGVVLESAGRTARLRAPSPWPCRPAPAPLPCWWPGQRPG